MITDTTVFLYKAIATQNGRGQTTNSYSTFTKSLSVNMQPIGLKIGLKAASLTAWGNTDLRANDKIMFYYPDSSVEILDRIKDASGKWYEVRGINSWGVPPFGHYEALLIPIQGES